MFSQEDINKNKAMGILSAVFNILAVIYFFAPDWKNSAYLKHRCNQTLLLLIVSAVINLASGLVSRYIGYLNTLYLVFWIINLVNAIQCTDKCMPGTESIKIIN